MTEEQINEVMRLVRDAVVTNSLFATEQIADMSIVGEAKCALVSHLRTIGEPGGCVIATVIERFSTDTTRGIITHDDRPSTYEAAEKIAGRKLDRRKTTRSSTAKVGPCAGHAVQRPDPLGVLSCTHPDCGRYEGPRSHECRAMADNACARPSICQGHAAQQEADGLVGLRGCNSRHGVQRAEEPCIYRMRTTDPGCTGCVERDEDQSAEAGD